MQNTMIGINPIEPIYKEILERQTVRDKVNNFVNDLIKAGCDRNDILNYMEAKGIGNIPLVKRIRVLNNHSFVACPVLKSVNKINYLS